MLKPKSSQLSFYGDHIYDQVIPEDHFLKQLEKAIDLSFGLCPNSPVKATGLDTSNAKHSTPSPALFQSFGSAHQKPLVSRVLFQTRYLGAS